MGARDIHTLLWRLYWSCPPQQAAHACLSAELARKTITADGDVQAWRRFVDDVILNFSLFGYAITRTTGGVPQVYPGHLATLKRELRNWVPITPNPARTYKGGGWHVTVMFEPVFERDGTHMHPTSPAFKTIHQSRTLARLEANLLRRDVTNTDPTIYTTLSNSISATKGSSIPWHRSVVESAHIAGQHPLPNGPTATTIADYVSARADGIRNLNHVTDYARRAAAPAVLGEPPAEPELNHRENIVSDGRDFTECRHLQQDTIVCHQTIDRLGYEIMFAWGVPPQVLGKNVNSERLASSNRLTEMAINHYLVHTRRLQAVVSEIFTSLQSGVAFGDCTSVHVLEQCGPYLKPSRAAELYACAYDLDVADFDIARFEDPAPAITAGNTRPSPKSTEATNDAKRHRSGYA